MVGGRFKDRNCNPIKRGFYREGAPGLSNIYFITGEEKPTFNPESRREMLALEAKSYAFYLTTDLSHYLLISEGESRALHPLTIQELENIASKIHSDNNPPEFYKQKGKQSFQEWIKLVQEV